jgi:predicted transcriptional regulator
MRLVDFIPTVKGQVLTKIEGLENVEIFNAYVSDLLSDVMGSVGENMAWITIMRHLNVVAVASLAGIPVVFFSKGIIPETPVIKKANEEGIHLVSSSLTTFDLAGILYKEIHS